MHTNIPPTGTQNQGRNPDQFLDLAIRLIRSNDQLALACHRLGIESQATPQPYRLHPEDIDLIVRQLSVALILAQESAQTARAASTGPQRYTGTARGDRAAKGRTHDPYPIYTAEELEEIENHQEGRAA
ncbi:hypothetical protein ACH9D2_16190 [Kocuria sp. M4R2S49]|uniref:hypothetical protein n=1 Tax=Kocuria rhizosphaericola TaxID=3376284 RepID=UPI0037B141BC